MLKVLVLILFVIVFSKPSLAQNTGPKNSISNYIGTGENARRQRGERQKIEEQKVASEKLETENKKKQEEYNNLAEELNTKNKQINSFFTKIKKCEASRNKSLDLQFTACGGKSTEQYTNEQKQLLNLAVKSQSNIKLKYDKFVTENTGSREGNYVPKEIVDTTDAMKYYANPNSVNQSAVNSDSGTNPQSTLEQRVAALEKEIKRLNEFIKKNIGDNKNSICQKVSICPQISNLKEKVDAINVIANPQGENSSGGGPRPPPPMNQ